LQRAELFDDQEPQDDDRAAGVQEILQPLPEAHAAQRSEIIEQLGNFVIEKLKIRLGPTFQITQLHNRAITQWQQGRKLNG
jgi:hypothetical protein